MLGAAGAALAGATVAAAARPAAAAPPSPLLKPRRVVFGTSVTRISVSQIKAVIPYVIVDGWDNATFAPNPGTYYQMDGRGLYTPPANGGLTIEQGFADQVARGALRSGGADHDWCVFETSRGLEDPALMAPVVDRLLAECTARGFRVAWIIPHVYLGAGSGQSPTWNEDVRAMLQAKVPAAGGTLHDWDAVVWQTQTVYPSLTQAQKDARQPLLYDGRHPTGGAQANPGPGTTRLAAMMQAATGL